MFFITTIRTIMIDGQEEFKTGRCWGYYHKEKDAMEVVLNNYTDIHENYYNWTVIEKIPEGIFPIQKEKSQWFKWDSDKYKHSDKPMFARNIMWWSLG